MPKIKAAIKYFGTHTNQPDWNEFIKKGNNS